MCGVVDESINGFKINKSLIIGMPSFIINKESSYSQKYKVAAREGTKKQRKWCGWVDWNINNYTEKLEECEIKMNKQSWKAFSIPKLSW